jgi:hypothetical protein
MACISYQHIFKHKVFNLYFITFSWATPFISNFEYSVRSMKPAQAKFISKIKVSGIFVIKLIIDGRYQQLFPYEHANFTIKANFLNTREN